MFKYKTYFKRYEYMLFKHLFKQIGINRFGCVIQGDKYHSK